MKLKSVIKIDLEPKNVEVIIVNIVITANFYKHINLDLTAIKLENSIYEPEVFPGLVYKCQNLFFLYLVREKLFLQEFRMKL